jgi:hypothetical protein
MFDKIFNYINNFINKNLSKLKWINRFVATICFYLLYQLFLNNSFSLNWSWSLIFFPLILLIGYMFQSFSWSLIISNKLKKEMITSWFLSLIGKYFPFKIAVPLLRLTKDLDTNKADTKKYFFGVIYEVFYQILAGSITVIFYFISKLYDISFTFGMISFLIILLISHKLTSSLKPLLLLTSLLGYVFYIFGIYALLSNLGYTTELDIAVAYIGFSTVSLLFIGSPAGIGIREYLFVTFFQTQGYLENSEYLQIAVLIRIIFVITDFMGYAVFKIIEFINK